VGVEIWRIEQFVPKRQPLSNTFYGGDAYIVLNTYMKKDKKAWNLHFWVCERTPMVFGFGDGYVQ
jgi:hypothetical protein